VRKKEKLVTYYPVTYFKSSGYDMLMHSLGNLWSWLTSSSLFNSDKDEEIIHKYKIKKADD